MERALLLFIARRELEFDESDSAPLVGGGFVKVRREQEMQEHGLGLEEAGALLHQNRLQETLHYSPVFLIPAGRVAHQVRTNKLEKFLIIAALAQLAHMEHSVAHRPSADAFRFRQNL